MMRGMTPNDIRRRIFELLNNPASRPAGPQEIELDDGTRLKGFISGFKVQKDGDFLQFACHPSGEIRTFSLENVRSI